MRTVSRSLVATMVLFCAAAAEARDSESAARLGPRGGAGSPAEASASGRPNAPQARADDAGPNPATGDAPKASLEPPRRGDGAQNSLSRDGNVFNLRVCNRSNDTALVAITRPEEGPDGWRVEGWWRVQPTACESIGFYRRGWIYYYADATDGGSWSGQKLVKCVRYPGPFSRLDDFGGGKYECRGNERLKGFIGWYVEDGITTHTWNLNP